MVHTGHIMVYNFHNRVKLKFVYFLYDRKNFAVVLWYGAVVVGVVGGGVGVCGQVGFRTITFVPVSRIF